MTQPAKVDHAHGKHIMQVIIYWLLLIPLALYTLAIVGLGLVVLFAPGDSIQLDFLRTGYSLLALLLPIAMLLAIFMQQRWLIALLIVPLIAQLLYVVPIFMPKAPQALANSTSIHVLTMNFLAHEPPQIKAGAELLAASDADIIMLQEFSVPAADYLIEALRKAYPYQALNPQDGRYNFMRGQGVFSRYPITDSIYWQYPDLPETHGNQRVVLDINGQEVVLYNVHPWPPFNLSGVMRFHFAEKNVISNREAVADIIERASAETAPVILAGDLNTGDQFSGYDKFASVFSDSYHIAGQGMGFTYPACGVGPLPPLIRLDYVFYSAPFQAMDAHIIDTCGISDHKALAVTLALPDVP